MLRAGVNLPPAWAKKRDQPLDDGLSSLVVLSGRALTIHGEPLEKFKVSALGRSVAVLPGKVRNEVLTALIVVRKQDHAIEPPVQKLLQGVADLAAAAVLQSRLFGALRDDCCRGPAGFAKPGAHAPIREYGTGAPAAHSVR